MASKKEITVRFCLTKSDGSPLEISEFSKDEIKDFRKCLSLNLTYCPNNESCARIVTAQIIYDGITPVGDEDDGMPGYFINRKSEYVIEGYPTPIVRFRLDRAMDEIEFLHSIHYTLYSVCTQIREQNDGEPYFAEDHNGWTDVLSKTQFTQVMTKLKYYGAYCGKIFHFPDGMPDGGYAIPAIDFALKPAAT